MRGTLEHRRFTTLLLGIFAALAAALTAIGMYGLLNYWVRVRQKEIAIRMALGARRFEILLWTGWQVIRIAVSGLTLEACGCWASSRILKKLVFAIATESPFMLLGASLAAGIPVLRATRIDPARQLQSA